MTTKLRIKILDAPAVPGGKAIMVTDEAGEPLPMQSACAIENGVGARPLVTVTLEVDGKDVKFE